MGPVCILGSGAWGQALACILEAKGLKVRLWSRRQSLAEAVVGAEFILAALPMPAVRPIAQALSGLELPSGTILISATKGLEPDTILTPGAIWQELFPGYGIAVLSGPNLAAEIRAGKPCATVVASRELEVAQRVQNLLATERLRVYINGDVRGVELGGALKNVIAISAGVCDGLDLGTNARSALVTRGLTEILRIGQLLGAEPATFYGLSGLGDLLATCTSPLSRNYQVGFGLGQGEQLPDLLMRLGTAEGVNTAHVLVQLAQQQQLELPIAQQVCALLDGLTTPLAAVMTLMSRDLKGEAGR